FLFFDHGHSPDPAGEFIASLDVIGALDVGLCVSGHGRPFREIPGRLDAYRGAVGQQLDGVRGALGPDPLTACDIVAGTIGTEPPPTAVGYAIEMTLSYLDHLALEGEAKRVDGDPVRWRKA